MIARIVALLTLTAFAAACQPVALTETERAKADSSGRWDGEWVGPRLANGGAHCVDSNVSITVHKGVISANLPSVNAVLTGYVQADGKLRFYGLSQGKEYRYEFAGTADSERMAGDWDAHGSGCSGSWRAKRQKSGSLPPAPGR